MAVAEQTICKAKIKESGAISCNLQRALILGGKAAHTYIYIYIYIYIAAGKPEPVVVWCTPGEANLYVSPFCPALKGYVNRKHLFLQSYWSTYIPASLTRPYPPWLHNSSDAEVRV